MKTNQKPIIITIDGPVASGKSTMAKLIAQKLGFYYLNTGCLYRAIAYLAQQQGSDDVTPQLLAAVNDISYRYDQGKTLVFYKNQDITQFLYHADIDQLSSKLSANPNIREVLLHMQRTIAAQHSLTADGRDCGSVVFPHADIKFYLTASVQERAQRLIKDTKRTYATMSEQEVIAEIEQRDQRDMTRKIAPLAVPTGAIIIDNSGLSKEQTLELFLNKIHQAIKI